MTSHSISVDSPTAIKYESGQPVRLENGELAPYTAYVIVERYDGRIVKVCAVVTEEEYGTAGAFDAAERMAYGYRTAYNAHSPVMGR